jgi:signal transduction histidine kinase/CheY-like chemotaxis protein
MRNLRVLHLEDSANDAVLAQRALERGGFAVEAILATNPAEFQAALEHGGLDLILVDNGVPGFSGKTALRLARQHHPEVPFVILSGTADAQDLRESLQAGANDFVVKEQIWDLGRVVQRAQEAAQDRRAKAEVEHHSRAMKRLLTAVQELSLTRDLSGIMKIVRSAARELAGADGATFILRDGDKCYYVDEDAIGPLWKGQRFPMSACISGWAMLNRQPAAIEDIYADSRIPIDAYRSTFVRSLVMVPIRVETPVGAIGAYWAQRHTPTPAEIEILQALANTTSVAIENVDLYSELERRVAQRTIQLEAANRELETFSYSVSHDLKAPLRSVVGFAQLLAEDCADQLDDQSKDYLRRIRTESKRMSGLIDDLLRLATFSRVALKHDRVNLSQIAHEVAATLRAGAPERQVEFKIQPGLTVEGDPGLLSVVMENLLSNAWKYSSKQPQAIIEFGADGSPEKTPVYFVRDNGAGFDLKHAGKLFAPFQRLHGQNEFPGNGVGLATVQRIIHRHGGRVWAQAQVGQGATFYFSFAPGCPNVTAP